jgi:N6-L-threonylcarbamoyladenine synthase
VNILGIETSCDETAAAVVRDGTTLLSNVIVSQIDIHRDFGGVVPEVAARSHIEVMLPTIDKALADAFSTGAQTTDNHAGSSSASDPWSQIDAIAVAHGPGLKGSLLIGTLTARTLALVKNTPLYPINHVEAHTYANFITETAEREGLAMTNADLPVHRPEFPLLSLTVSGGHTQLVLFHDHGDYELLGSTRDDAAGEAFDKVSVMLGLGYPGGPAIAAAAEHGDPHAFPFPKAKIANSRDFSFSGLKTAVLRHLQELIQADYAFPSFELASHLTTEQINDAAASFQRVAAETLVDQTLEVYHTHQPRSVVIAGGVAANQELRQQLADRLPVDIEYAPTGLCTDNAAMIASRGYFGTHVDEPINPHQVEVVPSLRM